MSHRRRPKVVAKPPVAKPPAGERLSARPARWLGPAGVVALAVLVVAAAWTWRSRGASSALLERVHPDVLLVTIDTLRADHLGCYGDRDAATPVLDALAARGVRYPNAVAHVPLTLPSHTSILTGLTPLRHGVRDNTGFVLGPGVPTLAEQFRRAGYLPAAFVSGFPVHHRFGLDRGFAVYDDRFPRGDDPARPAYIERRGDQTVASALAWLRQGAASAGPVFVWVHLYDPHAPYDPPEPFRSRFRDREYDGEIAFADQQVGVLLDGWRHRRSGRDPVVLVTADHGEGLGEHGEPTHGLFIYDSTIRVPFIVVGPGVARGTAPSTLARLIDIAPTLLDLAGLPPLSGIDGRSLRPSWAGKAFPDEPAYAESLFGRLSFGWAPLYGWREPRLMFVDAPRTELYDLSADPRELRNVADDQADDAARMRRAVEAAVSRGQAPTPTAHTPAESVERLRSLGYVAGGPIARPSLRDPKDLAAVAVRIENAIAIERADPPRAARELRDILRADPDNGLARRHLALALTAAERPDEAVVEIRRVVEGGDDSTDALTQLGDDLRRVGRLPEALDTFTRAAAKDPRVPDAFNGQGKVLTAMGRLGEAQEAFAHARSLSPDDPEALAGLADLALKSGDLAGARSSFEALYARDPADPDTCFKLGVVLARLGESERALGLLKTTVDAQPGNVDAVAALGGLLAKTGHPADAVPYFEKAVRAGAASPVVWNGLAMARLETGDQAGAVAALRESLRRQPRQPNIEELLRRLGR
jgi:arylsulfatase A-like enzyme/tetratricopeptide (TPR) repeat protein